MTSLDTGNLAPNFGLSNSFLDSLQEASATSFDVVEFLQNNSECTLLFESTEMNSGKPFLQVVEEPVEKFRFRYRSEMMGTHGSIMARSYERNRRKVYPSVQLCNCNSSAIVRCSLYTAQENEKLRTPHAHRLITRAENNMDRDDPHEIIVSLDNNYTAVFGGMGIIHTAKKNIVDELMKKKRTRFLEKLQAKNMNIASLTTIQEVQLQHETKEEERSMNLNSVSLCFEAFLRDSNNCLHPICEPVFSKPISNMKSALTGELKICRIDKVVGSCRGGDEVFMFVEKVGKKNIQVKFFEVDDDDHPIWCGYGKFSELDVHHQYAIAFRTPAYRTLDIEKPVNVFVQLYRPSDGACSGHVEFQYKPSTKMGRTRKQRKLCYESLQSGTEQNIPLSNRKCGNTDRNDLPVDLMSTSDPVFGSKHSNELLEENGIDCPDFQEFLQDFPMQDYIGTFDDQDFTFDGEKKRNEFSQTMVSTRSILTIETQVVIKEEIVDDPVKSGNAGYFNLLLKTVVQNNTILQMNLSFGKFTVNVENIFNIQNEEGDNAFHAAVTRGYGDTLTLMLNTLGRRLHLNVKNSQNISQIHERLKRAEQSNSSFQEMADADNVHVKEEWPNPSDYSMSPGIHQYEMIIRWCRTVITSRPYASLCLLYCCLQHTRKFPQKFPILEFFRYCWISVNGRAHADLTMTEIPG